MSEEEKKYQDQYNKLFGDDREIEDIIRQEEKDTKKIKVKEGDEPENQKDDIQQGNLSIDPCAIAYASHFEVELDAQ
jgi:hypothetical protein